MQKLKFKIIPEELIFLVKVYLKKFDFSGRIGSLMESCVLL